MTDTWWAINFWIENLIEVLILSFYKTEIPYVMRIETQVLKNKVFKTQGSKTCLTFFFFNDGRNFEYIKS